MTISLTDRCLVAFDSDCESGDPTPPSMNFRFSQFYGTSFCAHVGAGLSPDFSGEFPFFTSASSAMNLTLQDCQLTGGSVELGLPENETNYCSGAVNWQNSSFDEGLTWLVPTFNSDSVWSGNGPDLNTDLSLQITGSLFRGGEFALSPIPASAGDWGLTNNLFDLVLFDQDTTEPLACEYDGYWPYLPDQVWAGFGFTTNLQAGASGGPTQEPGEVFLPAAPPYQTGPYGNYYLPTNTLLYGAASGSAASLGLFHYTTRPDQVKEGNDTPTGKPNASIGLHYIAADGSGLPDDYDADGIPDYVENWNGDGDYLAHEGIETDWQDAMTVSGVLDASNSIYFDIDLGGGGLTGYEATNLCWNPLASSNPLDLSAASFASPISGIVPISPLFASTGFVGDTPLTLMIDGQEAYSYVQTTNGDWAGQWDTTTIANGPHMLSLKFNSPNDNNEALRSDYFSCSLPVNVNNPITFTSFNKTFSDLLVIDATVNNGATSCSIAVYDAVSSELLTTLSADVTDGQIETSWDLTDGEGNVISSNSITCVFTLTGASAATPSAATSVTSTYTKYQHNPYNNVFTVAWGNDKVSGYMQDEYRVDMDGVVQELANFLGNATVPAYSVLPDDGSGNANDPGGYISFNFSSAYPTSKSVLLEALEFSGNFFWVGHGDSDCISPTTGWWPNPILYDKEIGDTLLNEGIIRRGTNYVHSPYKLVVLFACTAYSQDQADAFGISSFLSARAPSSSPVGWWALGSYLSKGRSTTKVLQYFLAGKIPQAYVAWPCNLNAPTFNTGEVDEEFNNFTETFANWMNDDNFPLAPDITTCMNILVAGESTAFPNITDRDGIVGVEKWELSGCCDLRSTDRYP